MNEFIISLDKMLSISEHNDIEVDESIKNTLEIIANKSERAKGVLSVTITSLLKKTKCSEQDIRCHQDSMSGGYSGRGLDTRVVTPFMQRNNFPSMKESGWLTRSLEQKHPYNINYPGAITPKELKTAFLNVFYLIEERGVDAVTSLQYLLKLLIKQRDKNNNINLFKPSGKSIVNIVDYLEKHFSTSGRGGARLPVIAIFAIYMQMTKELSRYKNCYLAELLSHNSPDIQTGYVGDIQINTKEGIPLEAVEVKHGIEITADLIEKSYVKFQKQPIKIFYLLSTNEIIADYEKITKKIILIRNAHGCQVIVNGVLSSIKYYLRLLKDTDIFLNNYVSLVEKDNSLNYQIRILWNKIVNS